MDTMSIVTAHSALAGGAARLPGSRHLPHRSPAGAGAMSVALSRTEITIRQTPSTPPRNPTKVVQL